MCVCVCLRAVDLGYSHEGLLHVGVVLGTGLHHVHHIVVVCKLARQAIWYLTDVLQVFFVAFMNTVMINS